MFFNNVTVNGVALKVAFVRSDENGVSVTGMTDSGHTMEVNFTFVDGMSLSLNSQAVEAPKKERKVRKAKAAPEVAAESVRVAEVAELSEAEYFALSHKRGRRSEATKNALALYEATH